ncbi:4-alpha-glucanotransferase [Tepidiphilus baoligensis]|uniref:4-alpha-glucanotransferase n=1 Tax=Tepidiphilus baoligensis TaxID=2698687 RepID=A0ABX1QML6_9PROT|nr:4-alpha-glucanotransferase [Tepidiphilus baoligensis]NMH16464.1 4-alpha-glucanotransferase [Tepidiphilus baoligensis]
MTREERETLLRLARAVGIADAYHDLWGQLHTTPDETRIALLQAMGVITTETDLTEALTEHERRPWLEGLDPVTVVQQSCAPYRIPYRCAETLADQTHRWTLWLERGAMHQGEFPPAVMEIDGRREIDGQGYLEVAFYWHEPLPLGEHLFRIEPPAGPPCQTRLIVTPPRCHTPELLAGERRVWGIALQLYALRSERNWGMGDFTDLARVIAIAADAGAAVVGLNPLHALHAYDPTQASPYSPSSRRFLNPLYLDVEAIPEFAECAQAQREVAEPRFQHSLEALRATAWVDYAAVAERKTFILERLFAHFRDHHLARDTPRAAAYRNHLAEQGEALKHFAVHQALQRHWHRLDARAWGWPAWPESFRDPAAPAVDAFAATHADEVQYHAWLQWLAHEQLAACMRHGEERGVLLYLDLALSADRGGADTWMHQSVYALSASIGAPADDFNPAGQDWGLPPWIPDRLRRAAYAPFAETLCANMRHGAALRFDHVMALMRLFWIPSGRKPTEGTYVHYPLHDLLGILALHSVQQSCLVVGEDLGTVPDELRAALAPKGILSIRLLPFERTGDGEFKSPSSYPRQAVVAIGSHDLPTLAGYWKGTDLSVRQRLGWLTEEAQGRLQAERQYLRERLLTALAREGLLPPGLEPSADAMTPSLMLAIHEYVARTPAAVMMVQMEDVFGQTEQVNFPGTSTEYPNWRIKLPVVLEGWTTEPNFLALAERMRRAGRAR